MNILKTDRFISEKLLIAPMSKTRLADVGAKTREEKRLLEATFDVIFIDGLNYMELGVLALGLLDYSYQTNVTKYGDTHICISVKNDDCDVYGEEWNPFTHPSGLPVALNDEQMQILSEYGLKYEYDKGTAWIGVSDGVKLTSLLASYIRTNLKKHLHLINPNEVNVVCSTNNGGSICISTNKQSDKNRKIEDDSFYVDFMYSLICIKDFFKEMSDKIMENK